MSPGKPLHTDQPRDAGMTLVEVLISMTLFAVLGSLLLGLGMITSRANDDVRGLASVGEEARLGMERITRELRQASAVAAVSLPVTANDPTRLTIMVDLDGNGCISTSAADPAQVEKITYTWKPSTDELLMEVDGYGSPLLATKVTDLDLDLDSSSWQYDADHDGTTTWEEIDASSIGNHNPVSFSGVELTNIDLIRLTITTTDGSHTLQYTTRVDLRNQHPNEEATTCSPTP